MIVARTAPLFALVLAGPMVLAGPRDETKVEVKKVHICCPPCVQGVDAALKSVEGVEGKGDQKTKVITFTAKDADTARKALDALAAAGYHGDTGNPDLAIKEDSGVPAGKVKTLTLGGIHNCCRSCTNAVKEAIKKVEGATGDTVQPKAETFDVTGDYDAAELIKSLNAAGFHVKVKK